MDWQSRFSPYASRIVPSAIFALADMPRAPDTINLGPGEPSATLFPADRLKAAIDAELGDPARAAEALQYTVNAGLPRLRARIADYMQSRSVACTAENILITSGAQQGLDLLTELFVPAGARIAIQTPTYPGALGIFQAHGANICSIEEARETADTPLSLIYTASNFHNPTGSTLSIEERLGLIRLAEETDAVLIEDDCYETIWFDGLPLPSIQALDLRERSIEVSRTIYVSTFSKSICPGLRIGWVVAPSAVIDKLTLMKQSEDFQAGTLAQAAVASMMSFVLQEHAPVLRSVYRERRDILLNALDRHFPTDTAWTKPSGGFFVWLTLPDDIDTFALLPKAAHAGVTYVPGHAFSHDGGYRNALRLSYSAVSVERLEEGVRRLAGVVEAARRARA